MRETGTAVAEVAMSYTGDLSDPGENLYTLDYYLKLAEQIVDAGAHVLAIKDMAGLLRPQAATHVGQRAAQPVRPAGARAHPRHPRRSAGHLPGGVAGRRQRRRRCRRRRWRAPPASPRCRSIVAAAAHTEYDTGLSLAAVCDLEPYWEALRKVYAPFESGLPAPTGRVYHHEIPGGQLSNLRQQAIALGLGDRFEEIEENYAAADRMLGRLVKVTPSSKVVGDLALALVGAGVTADEFAADPARFDIPDSVIGFLRGELGDPPGGWPEPLRTKALAGRPPAKPTQELTAEDEAALARAGPKRQADAQPAAVPRSDKGIRGPPRAVRRHLEPVGQPVLLRAAARRRTPRHSSSAVSSC